MFVWCVRTLYEISKGCDFCHYNFVQKFDTRPIFLLEILVWGTNISVLTQFSEIFGLLNQNFNWSLKNFGPSCLDWNFTINNSIMTYMVSLQIPRNHPEWKATFCHMKRFLGLLSFRLTTTQLSNYPSIALHSSHTLYVRERFTEAAHLYNYEVSHMSPVTNVHLQCKIIVGSKNTITHHIIYSHLIICLCILFYNWENKDLDHFPKNIFCGPKFPL